MSCKLRLYRKITATHYVGSTGNEYRKEEYANHGKGGIHWNKKDLPADEYPYTLKYTNEYLFKCCEVCNCPEKTND